MNIKYQICTNCVMDTSAGEIYFDENGICNFCHYFYKYVNPTLQKIQSDENGILLQKIIKIIKSGSLDKKYDCILGLSGGLDSSYLAYLAVNQGLRCLAVHVDTGWNSKISEYNVKSVVNKLGLDLEIITVDWEEMRDLQLAFYKASIRNCEIPQDHAFLAALYQIASKYNIQYILSGGNLATESILPKSWGHNAADLVFLNAINKRFGSRKLQKFPTLSFWERYFYYYLIRKIREVRLLNYVPYNKEKAKAILMKEIGWQDYGFKHYESVLTRFFQGYYLPNKFGIDKRKAHLTSLILSKQLTREEALGELRKPLYSMKQLQKDKKYISEKLGITLVEWEEILALPPRSDKEFPSSDMIFKVKDIFVKTFGIRRRLMKSPN